MMDLGKAALVRLYCSVHYSVVALCMEMPFDGKFGCTSKSHSAILHPSIVVIKCGLAGGEGGWVRKRPSGTGLVGWSKLVRPSCPGADPMLFGSFVSHPLMHS